MKISDMKITMNVGERDRTIRVGLGIAMIALAVAERASGLVGLIGFILALTGFLRFCPAYSFLGKNTCQKG